MIELYNLANDPGETLDLSYKETALVSQLSEELSALKQRMNAQEPSSPK